jgi:hypothetical protein
MAVFPTPPSSAYDARITITQRDIVQKLGEGIFVGNWFLFVNANSMMGAQLSSLRAVDTGTFFVGPSILFRGKEKLTLPGAEVEPTPLPTCELVSLTSDKSLYRLRRDTVHLLIASPTEARVQKTLTLLLGETVYGTYTVVLDDYGLCLWSMRDLPEGKYCAVIAGSVGESHFEIAEYRLAPLHAELVEQQLSGEALRYTLSVTAFDQPYTGIVEVELQERGQRAGERTSLRCGRDGLCRGVAKLTAAGPYTLNVLAGERTATVALKGSEQERRETTTMSELGEARLLGLLPTPQSNECRGMYISRGGANTEPLLARRLVGQEIELVPRADIEFLRVVIVNPVRGTCGEKVYTQVKAEQGIRIPVPPPYGIVLLGAFIDGRAWEGWCTVLRPSELQLACEAPKEAKPGSRVSITLKTGVKDRIIPVQLLVKDQRLIAESDPQTAFAAAIKRNIDEWRQQSMTGNVERTLLQINPPMMRMHRATLAPTGMFSPLMASQAMQASHTMVAPGSSDTGERGVAPQGVESASLADVTKVRLSFPEVVHNSIVLVREQEQVEVTLGDGMTRYTVEAFALSPETLDWRRVETSIQATQPVYGELTVSPFVFPDDTVMGRLDTGATSGSVIVEVQHDGVPLPLFEENGTPIEHGMPFPAGTVVRFPVRPGAITAIVRDGRRGGSDVSERYVTEPGQLRHIVRRLHLLTPGQTVTRQDLNARELRVLPGLERPFTLFVEGATLYPFGCIEQSSTKLLAMYTGYVSKAQDKAARGDYEAALPIWYERVKSMYLPQSGFCLYPPSEGGQRIPDTHYAPLAVKHLLELPTAQAAQRTGMTQPALLSMLDDLRAMASDAAHYYNIAYPPAVLNDCQDAYIVLLYEENAQMRKAEALTFVRSRLVQRDGQVLVSMSHQHPLFNICGPAVAERTETAYAAATLLLGKETSDLAIALKATNYITHQTGESGRLYSTVDTAAGLALLTALRPSGLASDGAGGRVAINGQEMALHDAITSPEEVQSVTCVAGVAALQLTSEVVENWSAYKGQLAVEVRLERQGQVQEQFRVGDTLDLVIQVPRYEPGLLAHVCLPDALSRIVGGGQVKHFALDFQERNILRIPLAVTTSTSGTAQHWAVLVRNMFKQEQVGNPGLLQVEVV